MTKYAPRYDSDRDKWSVEFLHGAMTDRSLRDNIELIGRILNRVGASRVSTQWPNAAACVSICATENRDMSDADASVLAYRCIESIKLWQRYAVDEESMAAVLTATNLTRNDWERYWSPVYDGALNTLTQLYRHSRNEFNVKEPYILKSVSSAYEAVAIFLLNLDIDAYTPGLPDIDTVWRETRWSNPTHRPHTLRQLYRPWLSEGYVEHLRATMDKHSFEFLIEKGSLAPRLKEQQYDGSTDNLDE